MTSLRSRLDSLLQDVGYHAETISSFSMLEGAAAVANKVGIPSGSILEIVEGAEKALYGKQIAVGCNTKTSKTAASPHASESPDAAAPKTPTRTRDYSKVEAAASDPAETPQKLQKLDDTRRHTQSSGGLEQVIIDVDSEDKSTLALEMSTGMSPPSESAEGLRRRLRGKQHQATKVAESVRGGRSGCSASSSGTGVLSQAQMDRERALLVHPLVPKDLRNYKLYPRMYKQVMEALKSGQLPAAKMQVALSDNMAQWFVRLRNLRSESLFGQTSAELVVQLVWEYYQDGQSVQTFAFPDVAPIMRVLTPTGIYTDGKAGVCVLGLSGGGTWHGLEFKESVTFSSEFRELITHPSYEYKVQKNGASTQYQGKSHSIAIKDRGNYNEVVSTRSVESKPFVMDRLSSITQYMHKLLNHFEFEDWRSFTEDELKHPIGGFQRKTQQAFKPMEEHTVVMEKQQVIKQLDQNLLSKERELRAHSASDGTAKLGGAQRQTNDIKTQR